MDDDNDIRHLLQGIVFRHHKLTNKAYMSHLCILKDLGKINNDLDTYTRRHPLDNQFYYCIHNW